MSYTFKIGFTTVFSTDLEPTDFLEFLYSLYSFKIFLKLILMRLFSKMFSLNLNSWIKLENFEWQLQCRQIQALKNVNNRFY